MLIVEFGAARNCLMQVTSLLPHTSAVQETKQYFLALGGRQAEEALAQAQPGSALPAFTSTLTAGQVALQPAGPLVLSPPGTDSDPTAPAATAATAVDEQQQQQGLSEVHARLQQVLQHLPEAAESDGHEVSALGRAPSASKPNLAPVCVDLSGGKTPRPTQPEPVQEHAEQDGDDQQAAAEAPSSAVAAIPEASPMQAGPANETATAVEDAATAVDNRPAVPSSVQIMCGSLRGTFDAEHGVIHVEGRKPMRPGKVEIGEGKGNGKTWRETIKVDRGSGVMAEPLGKWLVGRKSRLSPALRAKQGLSSAVSMADGTVRLANQNPSTPKSSGPQAPKSALKHVGTSSLQFTSLHFTFYYVAIHHPSAKAKGPGIAQVLGT